MPRTLPWLKDAPLGKPSPSNTTRSQAARGVKRRRLEVPTTRTTSLNQRSKTSSSNITPAPSASDDDNEELRGPSSSPPNAAAAVPPDPPSPFREGEDDVWIMVEDEFNATAQLFTSHLHRAEYKRLKRKAAERSFNSLNERSTDNKTPRSLVSSFRDAQAAQKSRTRRAVKELGGVSDSEGEDWEGVGDEEIVIPDRNLANLMIRPAGVKVKSRTKLDSLVGSPVKSNTRAAAGFGKQDVRMGGFRRATATNHRVEDRSALRTSTENTGRSITTREETLVQPKHREKSVDIDERHDKPKIQSAPDDFPFARSSLIQRKSKPIKREKEEQDDTAEVPTFLH